MSDQADFVAGLERAHKAGPLFIELTAAQASQIISIIQLACRHPGTRGIYSRQVAEEFARVLQGELGRRSEDLGRLLERGWHEVFDVNTTPPNR